MKLLCGKGVGSLFRGRHGLLPTELPSHFLRNYGCRDFGVHRGGFAELLRILEKVPAAGPI